MQLFLSIPPTPGEAAMSFLFSVFAAHMYLNRPVNTLGLLFFTLEHPPMPNEDRGMIQNLSGVWHLGGVTFSYFIITIPALSFMRSSFSHFL